MPALLAVLLAVQQDIALPTDRPFFTFRLATEYVSPPESSQVGRKGEGAWYRRPAPDGSARFLNVFLQTSKASLTSDHIAQSWVPQDASRMGQVLTSHGEEKWGKDRKLRTVEIRMNDPTFGPIFIRGEALALRPRSMSVTVLGPEELEAEIRAEARRVVEAVKADPDAFTDEELFRQVGRVKATFWTGIVATGLYVIAWIVYLRQDALRLDVVRTLALAGLGILWGTVFMGSWTLDTMVKLAGLDQAPYGPYLAGMALAPVCGILVLVRIVRRIAA